MRSKRPLFSTRIRVRLLIVMGVLTLGAIGCQGDPTGPEFNPDFMVGDWLAESLAMTSVANPDLTVELDTLGAVFTLSVQPSGRYTAILEGFGQSSSEFGRLTVDGAYVVLMPESRALWERLGESVILEGESAYDFNVDGMTEPATLRQVLIPN